MGIQLSKERKQIVIEEIKTFFMKEREEDLSDFQAEIYLNFVLQHPGIYIYNQAIADAHTLITEKTEELFTLEKQVKI